MLLQAEAFDRNGVVVNVVKPQQSNTAGKLIVNVFLKSS